jgi:hypothetical protein
MIPHHHHDFDVAGFSSFHDHSEKHSHHESDSHHHHDADDHHHKHSTDSEKEHNHPFPFHHHLSAANDFSCLRIELNKNLSVNIPLLTVLNSFCNTSIFESPELDLIRFTDLPFKIKTIFEPGATGLRAPPSIA